MGEILDILLRSVEAADREALRQAFSAVQARTQALEILMVIGGGIIAALSAIVWKLYRDLRELQSVSREPARMLEQ